VLAEALDHPQIHNEVCDLLVVPSGELRSSALRWTAAPSMKPDARYQDAFR